MANIISDKYKKIDVKGRDYPLLKGDVRFELKNVHNGKTEVYENHNMITNCLADIFEGNYGGLLNYNNFANLYNTWLGGVLAFANPLDISDADAYGIPDRISNPCIAHAGQTNLTDQSDDTTRGNPDSTGTVLASGSTKLCWEWGTSAGNGAISALGLTHSDVGSYGCGVTSTAQQSLVPFAEVGCVSGSYSFGDNANAVLGIDGNMAYNIFLVNTTTVHIYKTPINNSKFKLQGSSLVPLNDYSMLVTATLPNAYGRRTGGSFYYDFDFANNKAILYGVLTEGGTTLYKDEISLADGTVTHSTITVTGAKLWQFTTRGSLGARDLACPTRAMVLDNHLYVYGYTTYNTVPTKIFIINLSNTADISEVDTSDFSNFNSDNNITSLTKRHAISGGIIVHDGFLINGDKTFGLASSTINYQYGIPYVSPNSISSAVIGINNPANTVSVCKLYLATKYNLPSTVNKNSSQSLRIEYTLQEV